MTDVRVVGHIRVRDSEKWERYCSQVPATLAPWGAEVLFRGVKVSSLVGGHEFTNTVMIRFAGRQAAEAWFASDAYQALIPLRMEAADIILLIYEG